MLPDSVVAWLRENWLLINDNLFSLEAFTQRWTLFQLALILLGFFLSLWMARFIEPRFEGHLRNIKEQPRLLRFLAILLRRTHWILFALLLWSAYAVMREITWYSRSYFIGVAATLVTAWLVISVASRAIRNRTASRIVAVAAWTAAALNVFGLLNPTIAFLDARSLAVGEVNITLWGVLKGVLLLTVLLWLANFISNFMEKRLNRSDDLTPSLQVLISKMLKVLLVTVAVFAALSSVGINLTALAVFGGALGLGIGFGLQKVVSNLISGMIILLDKSIKPGDVISLGDTFGWITTLRARYVSVVTRDGREYLIPNEDFVTQQVVNWSFSSRQIRLETEFGVGYECDPHQVRELAVEAASSVERVSGYPAPVCHVTGFGESSVDFILRFWIGDPEKGVANVRGLVLLALWDAFKKAGITFPYPRREVILHNPAPTAAAAPPRD